MKTNVSIELTDEQRDMLANVIDGKASKRLATRADVNALVQGLIDQCLAADLPENKPRQAANPTAPRSTRPQWKDHPNLTKHRELIEQRIRERGLTGSQAESYRRGWASTPTRA